MDSIPTTRKEAVWLACRAKRCCQTGLVLPTGRDIWRIVRALEAPPWSFLVYVRSPQLRPDAFLLGPDGPLFRLALAKRRTRRTVSGHPCIFLLRTRDGDHRCGLGALRPGVCRAFPAELDGELLCLRGETGCSCRRWTLADVDIAEETALVAAREADQAEYCAIVARWNAVVLADPPGATRDFLAFCHYLIQAYDALAAPAEPVAP